VKRTAALLLVFVVALVFALTPAGTEIRNQASASYIDSAGQPQTTTSNEVVTVVQPVYHFSIKPDGKDKDHPGQTQSAVPGGKVYFPYTVTNEGNATDTIDLTIENDDTDDFDLQNPEVYLDENCNGQVDPGESPLPKNSGKWQLELAMDQSACLIVEGTIPSNQQDGDKSRFNLAGKGEAGTPTDTSDDVDETGDPNWAQAIATEKASLTSYKSATPSGSVKPGNTIVYTIQGQNVGGSAAYAIQVQGLGYGILIEDKIPAKLTVTKVEGSAGAGTVQFVKSTDGGSTWQVLQSTQGLNIPGDANGDNYIGMFIKDPNYDESDPQPFFPQGAQYTFTFYATVNEDATPSDTITNTAVVKFSGDDDGDADDPGETVQSNTTTNDVAPSYGVLNGTWKEPGEDDPDTPNEFTYKDHNYVKSPSEGDDDTETLKTDETPVYGGDTVYFPFTLQNTGNTDDTFDLSLTTTITDPDPTDDVTPTWTCQIVASDGTTPISGPVGPIPAGGTYDYVVKCSIPADYEETGSADAAHIEVTATSQGDPSQSNKVTGIVPDVKPGYDVDIAQPGKSGDGDKSNDYPPVHQVEPGESVKIPFEVANTGNNPDTYDLTTTLPSGWDGTIYPVDCDDPTTLPDPLPAPVSDTGLIDAGQKKCFILVVDVPQDQAPVDKDGVAGPNPDNNNQIDDNVYIKAKSHADPSVEDEISTDVEVKAVAAIDFTPDRSGTVTSPGTIVYSHTVTNNGNEPADVKFTLDSDKDNWTYQIRVDTNGENGVDDESWVTLDPNNPTNTLLDDLPAGASRDVEVRVIVPDGEPVGAVDAAEITAEATFNSGGTDSDTVTDTTTIVGGDLRLEKEVDKTEAKPGEILQYTITATNIGTADLRQVIISDPLPGYTKFESLAITISGFPANSKILYSTNGTDWNEYTSEVKNLELSAGDSIYVGVSTPENGSADTNIDQNDIMPPGAKIVIIFKVKVQ